MFIILTLCITVSVYLQSGDIEIVNHRTKETCQLKFSPYSYFSRDVPRKVNSSRDSSMMSYNEGDIFCEMLPPAGPVPTHKSVVTVV